MSEAVITRLSLLDMRMPSGGFSPLYRPDVADPVVVDAPVEAADDLFALGVAEGERMARVSFSTERDALFTLLAAAEALQPEPSEELAAMIATTVERLVTEIVGEIQIDRTWMLARIDRAIGHIGEADAARTLWLHPEDLALLSGAELLLDTKADHDLERGALRIDCSSGWIEDSRSLHLEALRATLGAGAGQ